MPAASWKTEVSRHFNRPSDKNCDPILRSVEIDAVRTKTQCCDCDNLYRGKYVPQVGSNVTIQSIALYGRCDNRNLEKNNLLGAGELLHNLSKYSPNLWTNAVSPAFLTVLHAFGKRLPT